jgi:hypothetical protein
MKLCINCRCVHHDKTKGQCCFMYQQTPMPLTVPARCDGFDTQCIGYLVESKDDDGDSALMLGDGNEKTCVQ